MPDFLIRLTDVTWRTIGNIGFVTTRIDDDGTYRGVPVTVIQPTEELAGFKPMTLLSTSRPRSQKLISAGYRDATRELARRERAKKNRAKASVASAQPHPFGQPHRQHADIERVRGCVFVEIAEIEERQEHLLITMHRHGQAADHRFRFTEREWSS